MRITTWRYHLPSVKGEGWAIIFMDSLWCFSVLSDWGNYGHRWPVNGAADESRDFRAFIVRADDDYILRKIAPRDEYDGDRTCRALQRHILERRRERAWTRERARSEWDLLYNHCHVDSREEFAFWHQDTTIEEPHEFAVYDSPRQTVAFIEHVMPRLRCRLSEELRMERERPPAAVEAST